MSIYFSINTGHGLFRLRNFEAQELLQFTGAHGFIGENFKLIEQFFRFVFRSPIAPQQCPAVLYLRAYQAAGDRQAGVLFATGAVLRGAQFDVFMTGADGVPEKTSRCNCAN